MNRCPVCGFEYEPSTSGGCSLCPVHAVCGRETGSTAVCCPNCGAADINVESSVLAGWLKRVLQRGHRLRSRGSHHRNREINETASLANSCGGSRVRIKSLTGLNAGQRQHLESYGFTENSAVEVIAQSPLTIIRIEQTELALDAAISRMITVETNID